MQREALLLMIDINIPYLSQLKNKQNPYGSCNVTSAAMVLDWAGIPVSPDLLYQSMINRGLSRHSPYDLAIEIENHGAISTFAPNAKIEQIKEHLKKKKPIIVHGYFTGFGHIIVIKGFNEKGFICHDPYGEWSHSGYIINNNLADYGKNIIYSFDLIKRLCDEGGIWTHFVDRKSTPPTRPPVSPQYQGISLQDVFYDDLKVPIAKIFNFEIHINFQLQVNLGPRYTGKRDAIFGPKTQQALESFCEESKLPADPIAKPLAKALIEGKGLR